MIQVTSILAIYVGGICYLISGFVDKPNINNRKTIYGQLKVNNRL